MAPFSVSVRGAVHRISRARRESRAPSSWWHARCSLAPASPREDVGGCPVQRGGGEEAWKESWYAPERSRCSRGSGPWWKPPATGEGGPCGRRPVPHLACRLVL